MKALSIRQPWAWAILNAGKDIENRSWWTNVRGTVLIHASGGMTRREYSDFLETMAAVRRAGYADSAAQYPALCDLKRGGIVGQADIVDCVAASESPWFFGPCGFVLSNPKPLPFTAMSGRLGFFEVEGFAP